MDTAYHDRHERPPRTLREVLGKATVITGIIALGLWIVTAVAALGVLISLGVDNSPASAWGFAIVEFGAALVVLAAAGMFATAAVFLVTHAFRALRKPKPKEEPPAEHPGEAGLAE